MNPTKLKLRPGDLVEVRSEAEILATLDPNGRLDNLPFMPEMLAHCGRQYRVEKRADKTCDTINYLGNRRMYDTVHLAGMRCDGSAHGNCDAACPFYWKEAWLKRVNDSNPVHGAHTPTAVGAPKIDHDRLVQLTRRAPEPGDTEVRYQCQATEILTASHPMKWWDVRQYIRDVRSGNVGVSDVFAAIGFRLFRKTISARWFRGYTAAVRAYNRFQRWRGGPLFPETYGTLDKTPKQTLDLLPGERVRVKSLEDIRATVNARSRNRGLSFDAEMVRYCETEQVVRSRVEQIIDERSGKMVKMSSDCIILENAVCQARCSHKRLFCPRLLYPFWREIWLERLESEPAATNPARVLTVKSSAE